jgi:hypothetical protein
MKEKETRMMRKRDKEKNGKKNERKTSKYISLLLSV